MFKFVGREDYLDKFEKLYARDEFSFAVVYGRRRVGKSSLINHFIDISSKSNIKFMALEQSDADNLRDFSEVILNKFPAAKSYIDAFDSWSKAFDYIVEQVGDEKLILFIDEFPYIANSNNAISSILQKYIDGAFINTKIKLILCGSSMSFMENQILGHQSPLYGRRDMQIKVLPFDYYDTSRMCKEWSNEEKSLLYSVTSGIPHYLQKIIRYDSFGEGVVQEFFNVSGALYEEPRNLLLQELREPALYNTIIKAIGQGSSKLNEIATKTDENNSKISKYLTTLISLHVVEREVPIGNESGRNGIYKLTDNMFKFWYKFVVKNNLNIQNGMGDYVWENKVKPELSTYMGHIFEEMCVQYLNRENKHEKLQFVYNQIGRWWGTNKLTKEQEEIDVLATNETTAIFAECKWKNERVGLQVLNDLKRKAELFSYYEKKYFYIFSKSGFKKELISEASIDENLVLVSLDDMFICE